MTLPMLPENHIVVFNDHTIRRVFIDDLWWFSVIDVNQIVFIKTFAKRHSRLPLR